MLGHFFVFLPFSLNFVFCCETLAKIDIIVNQKRRRKIFKNDDT